MMKYKSYIARTKIEAETGLIYGEVVGPRDVITFQGESVAVAYQAFKESVDLYLKTCEKHGLEPDKPFNGLISYRTAPKTHRRLVQVASALGLSVNQYLDKVVRKAIRDRHSSPEEVAPAQSPAESSPVTEPVPSINYNKPGPRRIR